MDLTQRKLTKSEWESLEIPIPDKEKTILKMIYQGYNSIHYRFNSHKSLINIMKLESDDKGNIHNYLFDKYFKKSLSKIVKKYNIDYDVKKFNQKIKIKKSDQIRIDNIDSKIKHIQSSIFEVVIIEQLQFFYKNVYSYYKEKNNNYKFNYHKSFYTLYNLNEYSIKNLNPIVEQFIHFTLKNYYKIIDKPYIIKNGFDIIERNETLLQYADLQLYDHQKKLYSIVKNNAPKLILYQAPTGTGKTISPVGLTHDYNVIFVCAAKHVGLQLAKSCISLEIPIAIAFGCNDPGDIRLHYYAAKEIVKNFKTGGIYRVDNSVGDKVKLIVCDIQSYTSAMNYMLAFNKNSEIITYWDEPTITLDYKTHSFHKILQKNWRENVIPNVILSSATLPSQQDLPSMISYFKSRFDNANIVNIVSHECKKTIPIYNTKGIICLPHVLYSDYKDLKKSILHCSNYKTLLRHFDLREILTFIDYLDKNNFIHKKQLLLSNYFTTMNDLQVVKIKEYYIDILRGLKKNWNEIYTKYCQTLRPRFDSLIRITTDDAYTLTDGPTIYLAEDVEHLGKVLLNMTNIPKQKLQKIHDHIQHNNKVKYEIQEIEKQIEEYMDKTANDGDKKMERKMRLDPKIQEYKSSISQLSSQIKNANIDNYYIPNKKQHLERYNKLNSISSFTSDISEDVVEEIMMTSVDPIWKMLLLLGIGVFTKHNDVHYLEIMKKLAIQQKLYLIIASSDYIYGTNYQFCHGYIGKDLENMTQEKIIQAFGRVGRNSTQLEYSIRIRDNSILHRVFQKEDFKQEVIHMNTLFGTTGLTSIEKICIEIQEQNISTPMSSMPSMSSMSSIPSMPIKDKRVTTKSNYVQSIDTNKNYIQQPDPDEFDDWEDEADATL